MYWFIAIPSDCSLYLNDKNRWTAVLCYNFVISKSSTHLSANLMVFI